MNRLKSILRIISIVILSITMTTVYADCGENCCGSMGGVHYCDSSAGRYVCKNGDYSACYCTRHAVMDLQKIAGCCLWQGGVLKITEKGLVLCNNGNISEMCSLQQPHEKAALY